MPSTDENETTATEEVGAEKMRDALAAIAQEMQKFHSVTTFHSDQSDKGQSDTKELKNYKAKLKLKKIQIKKLKHNLKTAYVIAKTVMAAKENETLSLNNHLTSARNELASQLKQNEDSSGIIQKITIENQVLNDKLLHVHNFIDLGYQELQKMRNINMKDVSLVTKLKQIMVYCGQYYADYCNEHEKCLQLEQRNRFLSNKLSILENNLEAATDQLRNLQYQKNIKPKMSVKNKAKIDSTIQKVGYVCSEYAFGQKTTVGRVPMEKKESVNADNNKHVTTEIENWDLSSHLSLVKNLLNDQDTMLNDLKKLSEEMKNNELV